MFKEKVEERHEILERIKDEMTEEFFAAHLSAPDDENDVEVLRVLFEDMGFDNEDGAIGEFLFAPFKSEEDEVQYFISAVTVADDLNPKQLPLLYKAMSILNFYMPCGSFSIDSTEKILAFKLATPLPIELAGDGLYDQVNICMGNAVAVTDQFCDLLLRIDAGELDIDGMKEELGL